MRSAGADADEGDASFAVTLWLAHPSAFPYVAETTIIRTDGRAEEETVLLVWTKVQVALVLALKQF